MVLRLLRIRNNITVVKDYTNYTNKQTNVCMHIYVKRERNGFLC